MLHAGSAWARPSDMVQSKPGGESGGPTKFPTNASQTYAPVLLAPGTRIHHAVVALCRGNQAREPSGQQKNTMVRLHALCQLAASLRCGLLILCCAPDLQNSPQVWESLTRRSRQAPLHAL